MVLVGWLLVGGLVVSAAGSGSAYRSGGYTGQFWALPLEEKLAHLHANRGPWRRLSAGSILGVAVTTAGITGLTYLLTAAGEGPLAWSAFGLYLTALIAWSVGLIAQTATLPIAATQQAETGATPAWIHGFWNAGYLGEALWVTVGNLYYALVGIAILSSAMLPDWAGWVAVAWGLVIPVVVLATRFGFPEMTQVLPFVLGIGLLAGS